MKSEHSWTVPKILCVALLSLAGLWLLACVALSAYLYLAMPKSPIVDDSDLRLVESAVSDDENAYVAFLAVTNLLDCSSEDKSILSAYSTYCGGQSKPFRFWREDGTPETCRAEVDRILTERAEGLKGLHQAFLRSKYRLIPDADGLCFPPVSAMTLAHRLLQAQADRARESGDFATAVTAGRDGLLFATLCRDNALTFVEWLVGSGMGAISCRSMVRLANEDGVSDELLTTVAELLKDDFDENALFEQTVKREYVNFSCWALDKTSGSISVYELPTGLCTACPCAPSIVRVPGLVRFAYNKEMTRQDLVNVFRAGLAGCDADELVPQPRSIFQPNFAGRILALTVTPAFKDIRDNLKRTLFVLRATRTAVAIRRYGRANGGAVPTDLSALVPTCLAEVPRDPFAPDRVLGYDAVARRVWTVGPDGDFNALDSEPMTKSEFKRKGRNTPFGLMAYRISMNSPQGDDSFANRLRFSGGCGIIMSS